LQKSSKTETMKTVAFKWLLGISALLFADWVIMIILGCFSSLCKAGNDYYCTVYCKIGIILLAATLGIAGYLLFKKVIRKKQS